MKIRSLFLPLISLVLIVACGVPAPSTEEIQEQSLVIPSDAPSTQSQEAVPDIATTQTQEPFQIPNGNLLFRTIELPLETQTETPSPPPDQPMQNFVLKLSDQTASLHPAFNPGFPLGIKWISPSPDFRSFAYWSATYEWGLYGSLLTVDGSDSFYLLGPNDKEPLRLAQIGGEFIEETISWSLDGRFIITGASQLFSPDMVMYIYDLQTGSTKQVIPNADFPDDPAISPSGDRIAFSTSRTDGDGGLYLINADGSNEQLLVEASGGLERITEVKWNSDGTKLFYYKEFPNSLGTDLTGADAAYDLITGTEIYLGEGPDFGRGVMSPDGKLYMVRSRESSHIVSTTTYETLPLFAPNQLRTLVWSPDNLYVAYEDGDGSEAIFYIMDTNTGQIIKVDPRLEFAGDVIHRLVAWLP